MTPPAAASSYKRRNFYIDKDFQTKFILKFCGLVAGGALLTICLLYVFAQCATTVAIVNARVTVASAADYILPLLVQTVVITTIIVGIAAGAVTLFVSHKIAGPLFRFKQTLKELSAGNFTNQVRLRKGDQLTDLQEEFNNMAGAVHDVVREYENFRSEASASGMKDKADALQKKVAEIMPGFKV